MFSIVSSDRTDSCACESIWAGETRENESLELAQILLGVYIRILLKNVKLAVISMEASVIFIVTISF